jgi:hypothetical protein
VRGGIDAVTLSPLSFSHSGLIVAGGGCSLLYLLAAHTHTLSLCLSLSLSLSLTDSLTDSLHSLNPDTK